MAVRRALGDLPAEQKLVLELAYFGGLTQQEIAVKLGEPLGTIKTRMRLGMQKLRRALPPMQPLYQEGEALAWLEEIAALPALW